MTSETVVVKKGIIDRFIRVVDFINTNLGKAAAFLILVMMVTIVIEVVSRYVFNSPTKWVWPVNRQIFGAVVLFGGAWAMIQKAHIRVDILYVRFPRWLKITANYIGFLAFLAFLGALLWEGTWMAANAIQVRELGIEAIHLPLYPFKTLFPIAAFLFILQGIAGILRDKTNISSQ